MNGDQMNQHNSPTNQNWQYENILPNSSIPNYQTMDISSSNLHVPPRLDMGLFLPTNIGSLPPALSDFPIDSSFIERAAKFSNFNAGNFSTLLGNPSGFLKTDTVRESSMNADGTRCESAVNMQTKSGNGVEEPQDVNNLSVDSSSRGINVKKRKSNSQNMELDHIQGSQQHSSEVRKENSESKNIECSSSTPTSGKKSSGKKTEVNTEEPKQDYIHVRARRGQATNSHSLAERVRRERISERMKYLQDLVPGCSKVTGKAVMLDEIINYVQSLQRQVEFLSMKLSTVNPGIDGNIERLLSKDILQPQVGSSSLGFLPDIMHHPQFMQSQHGMLQNEIPGMVNHSESIRRAVNSQFPALNLLKGPSPQLPNPWDTELQNMLQMNFNANNQEFDGKAHNTFQQ